MIKQKLETKKRLIDKLLKRKITIKEASDLLDCKRQTIYKPSEVRKPRQELQQLLTITIRRYVYTDSTVSLFGIRYKIPFGYIGCRIWLYLKVDKVSLEAMGRIIYRFRLKV